MAGPKRTSATLAELSLLFGGAGRSPDGRANRGRASAPSAGSSPGQAGNIQVDTSTGNVQVDTGTGNVQVDEG